MMSRDPTTQNKTWKDDVIVTHRLSEAARSSSLCSTYSQYEMGLGLFVYRSRHKSSILNCVSWTGVKFSCTKSCRSRPRFYLKSKDDRVEPFSHSDIFISMV